MLCGKLASYAQSIFSSSNSTAEKVDRNLRESYFLFLRFAPCHLLSSADRRTNKYSISFPIRAPAHLYIRSFSVRPLSDLYEEQTIVYECLKMFDDPRAPMLQPPRSMNTRRDPRSKGHSKKSLRSRVASSKFPLSLSLSRNRSKVRT